MSSWRLVKENFLTKQFLVFLLIGGINTLNGMVFPAIFSLFLQSNLAYAISFIPSLGISYILNSIFTFKTREFTVQRCVKFYLSYLPNFLIQNGVFYLCYNCFHVNKFIGIFLASALGIPVTFLLLKFFAFNSDNNSEKEKKPWTE